MTKQDDGLFLLEVLIDKIVFVKSPCFSDRDFRTCVNIKCPAVEALEICDDDPGSCVAKSGGPFVKTFNTGKSCLFSIQEADITKAMSSFPVKLVVYKSLPCGCLPTKIIMGEATIDMTKEFVQARQKYIEDPTNVSYEALKDSFRIFDPDKAETGEVVMFLRISCFGKSIITRFQGGSGPPNLGAGTGTSFVDRSCVPGKNFQTSQDPCVCGVGQAAAKAGPVATCSAPCRPGSQIKGHGVCPPVPDPYDSMPCADPDDPCYCAGPKPEKPPPMVCKNTHQYCLHVPKDCCPVGNKVIFQMPSDSCAMNHKQRAHFNFTSDGVGDVARDEPGQLLSTTSEDYPGVVYDFPSQIIKLRVGKYIEMPGRKTKLEYQFITPAVTHEKVIPVTDTRTAQCSSCNCSICCPFKLKRGPTSLPFYQDLKEDQIMDIKSSKKKLKYLHTGDIINLYKAESSISRCETQTTIDEYLRSSYPESLFSIESFEDKLYISDKSLYTFRSKKRSVSFCDKVDYVLKSYELANSSPTDKFNVSNNLFGKEEFVYTLVNDFSHRRTSGTQATASVNKCLQVTCNPSLNNTSANSNAWSSCNVSMLHYRNDNMKYKLPEQFRYSNVYYFGRKRCNPNKIDRSGMGYSGTKTKPHKDSVEAGRGKGSQGSVSPTISAGTGAGVQAKSPSTTSGQQTTKISGTNGKAVTIVDDSNAKSGAVPACSLAFPEMVATVSHIRIGPKEPCPGQGLSPCIGPTCLQAERLGSEDEVPVKVTTVSNPRRGVFEIVIRKLTGAPLGKNELMLEWTPPLCRPSSCAAPPGFPCGVPPCGVPPCGVPCSPSPICRPPRYRSLRCRRPSCWPKYCKKSCRKPCGPCGRPCGKPCRTPLCRRPCKSPCGRPCRSLPCGPISCVPSKCGPPLCVPPVCGSPPCVPTPCLPPPCGPAPCGPLPCASVLCGPLPCGPPLCSRQCAAISCVTPCSTPCRLPCCYSPCRRPCKTLCKRRYISPCKRPCRSPCKRPCWSPSRLPCWSPCRLPCRSPCRLPCRSPCMLPCDTPCKTQNVSPCDAPCKELCESSPSKQPCESVCESPCKPCSPICKPCIPICKRPCRSPCKRPCKSPCKRPCKSPCIHSRPCRSPCMIQCKRPCPRLIPCVLPSRLACRECCLPCATTPCKAPCGLTYCVNHCTIPCKSTPCFRQCPIVRRRPRKICSQPKIKPRCKIISPCCKRTPTCPVVRCRSGPCFTPCGPAPYPARSCSAVYICPSQKCTYGRNSSPGNCFTPFPYRPICWKS